MRKLKRFALQRKVLFFRVAAFLFPMIFAMLLLSQTAFAKNTYLIHDGGRVTVYTTYATDPAEVLDEAGAVVTAETAILYGTFIQTIIDFLVTAFAIFLVLRIIMKVKEKLNADEIAEAAAKKAAEEAAAKEKADAEAAAKAEAEAKIAAEREEELRLLREIAASLKK